MEYRSDKMAVMKFFVFLPVNMISAMIYIENNKNDKVKKKFFFAISSKYAEQTKNVSTGSIRVVAIWFSSRNKNKRETMADRDTVNINNMFFTFALLKIPQNIPHPTVTKKSNQVPM